METDMKFTAQNTIDREFCLYSDPMTKDQLAEIWARVYPRSYNETGEKIIEIMTKLSGKLNDQDFVYNFNRTLNIKIRSFAPGLFQIRYNDVHTFN